MVATEDSLRDNYVVSDVIIYVCSLYQVNPAEVLTQEVADLPLPSEWNAVCT